MRRKRGLVWYPSTGTGKAYIPGTGIGYTIPSQGEFGK